MSTAFVPASALLAARMKNKRSVSDGPAWLSLESGGNVVRIVTDGKVNPMVSFLQHGGKPEGKYRTALDLEFVMQDEALFGLAEGLTKDDSDLVGRYGDPCSQLVAALPGDRDTWPDEYKNADSRPLVQKGTLAVAIMNGELGLLRLTAATANTIDGLWMDHPELVDAVEGYEIKITKQGTGKATRYQPQIVPTKPGAVELPSKMPDPYEALARSIVGYEKKLEFTRNSFSVFIDWAKELSGGSFEFGGV